MLHSFSFTCGPHMSPYGHIFNVKTVISGALLVPYIVFQLSFFYFPKKQQVGEQNFLVRLIQATSHEQFKTQGQLYFVKLYFFNLLLCWTPGKSRKKALKDHFVCLETHRHLIRAEMVHEQIFFKENPKTVIFSKPLELVT